jgi:hypothetical protein
MELISPGYGLILFGLVYVIVVFTILFFLLRWIFRVNRQVRLQEQQLAMLTSMALKLGVEKEVVEEILNRK